MDQPLAFPASLTLLLTVTQESLALSRAYHALALAGVKPTAEDVIAWVRRHPEATATRKDCGREGQAERIADTRWMPRAIKDEREWNLRPHGRLRACIYALRTIRELAAEEEKILQAVQPSTVRCGSDALEAVYNALDEIRISRKWPARLP